MKYKTKYKRLKEHCDNRMDWMYKDIDKIRDTLEELRRRSVVGIRGHYQTYPDNHHINDVVEAVVEHLGINFKGQPRLRAEEQDEA